MFVFTYDIDDIITVIVIAIILLIVLFFGILIIIDKIKMRIDAMVYRWKIRKTSTNGNACGTDTEDHDASVNDTNAHSDEVSVTRTNRSSRKR